jgi:hypothetical protein
MADCGTTARIGIVPRLRMRQYKVPLVACFTCLTNGTRLDMPL